LSHLTVITTRQLEEGNKFLEGKSFDFEKERDLILLLLLLFLGYVEFMCFWERKKNEDWGGL